MSEGNEDGPGKKTTAPSEGGDASTVISVVSWEDRFILGLERLLEEHDVSRVILLRYKEWEMWTDLNTTKAQELSSAHGTTCDLITVFRDYPERTWRDLNEGIDELIQPDTKVIVDISTMQREAIWTVFFFLDNRGAQISYAYHRPISYAKDWLSRDPDKPRFMFQMSGESRFGRETVLLVATGFDLSRTKQLMRDFEPSLTLLALQEGEQFQNMEQNVQPHELLKAQLGAKQRDRHLRSFWIDSYAADRGLALLVRELEPHLHTANVIMSSLGPKLSAVALYQIHRTHSATALVYAPARDYNRKYSKGIGDTVYGKL